MALISMNTVRNQVQIEIPKRCPYNSSKHQKLENIESFSALSRDDLQNSIKERRVLLYETLDHERIYLQYPGIESTREERRYELDARPILQRADGSCAPDMDFKKIWDIIDRIGQAHRGDIDILATIFLRIAYMLNYEHQECNVLSETIDIPSNQVINSVDIPFVWNRLCFDTDTIETLNDRFGDLEGISLEGFLYYNDVLAQNEDCKYHYLYGNRWDIKMGRINNCLSHLTVISHIRDCIGISKLIDSFQQGRGVAPLPQNRFAEACGDLVIRV